MKNFVASQDLLKDKIILITGSSDGIGREAALAFAQHGATVILLGRKVSKLEKVYDEIIACGAPQPAIYPMDLSSANPDAYQRFAQRIAEEWGHLDGLLHNAAILGSLTPIEQYDIKRWYTVMQTNLNAPFLLTQTMLPLLRNAKDAAVVFTGANEGKRGRAYWGAYSVAKFAIHGLMQILADELENTRIRVNCINPGIVRTKLRAEAYPAENRQRTALPESLMQQYLYLFSAAAKDVRGQWINAQGTEEVSA